MKGWLLVAAVCLPGGALVLAVWALHRRFGRVEHWDEGAAS